MRIHLGKFCIAGLLGLGLIVFIPAAHAENDGQAELNRAFEAKLSAKTAAELGAVIDLCQQSLDKGLDVENKEFCKQLLRSALVERASLIVGRRDDDPDRQKRRAAASWRAALKDIERAVELGPPEPRDLLMLGSLQLRDGGDREKARLALDEAIRLAEKDVVVKVEALRLRAGLRKDLEDTLKDYSQAIGLAPRDANLLRSRGEIYLRRNQADKALADFDAAIKLGEDDFTIHDNRGQALEALKRYPEARDSYGLAVAALPGVAYPLMRRAAVCAMAGDHEQVLADTSQVLAIDPAEPLSLMLRAGSLAQLERFQEALSCASQALALQPDSTYVITLWAFITEQLGKSQEAIEELERRVKARPDDSTAWLQLGLIYGGKRRWGKAVDAFGAAIELGQFRGFAFQRRGDIYLNLAMRKEARADYEESLKFDPENRGVLNNLAWILATAPEQELRDGSKALELALKASELTDFQQAHVLSTLAAAYAETGDMQAAREWSQKAVDAADFSLKDQLRKELACYEQGRPWRDDGAPTANEKSKD